MPSDQPLNSTVFVEDRHVLKDMGHGEEKARC